jgi:hypothetical protein
MRLIVISAVERDLGPIYTRCATDGTQHILKTPHLAECFGREAYLLAKDSDKVSLTQSKLIGYGGDCVCMGSVAKTPKSQIHGPVQLQTASSLREQHDFADLEHGF